MSTQDLPASLSEAAIAEEAAPAALAPPLTAGMKLWYALGQTAEGIKNESFGIFLLFYYTNVLNLSGSLAGLVILISLCIDAITDPLAGTLSDRFRSRWGRRHPFMYASALPLGLSFYAIFAPPTGLSQTGLFVWMLAFTVLCRLAMTLFHVPHAALGAELSSDYEERTEIVLMRTVASRIGLIVPGVLGLMILMRPTERYADGRFNPEAYPAYALIAAVAMTAAVFVSAQRTHARIPYLPGPSESQGSERGALASLFRNLGQAFRFRSFRALFFGNVISFVGWGVTGTMVMHMATFFWQVTTDQLFIWGVGMSAGLLLGLPFWAKASARWDKKPIFVVGCAIFVAFAVPPPLLRAFGLWPETSSVLYMPLWILTTGFVAHFGIAGPTVTGSSMMADVTDLDACTYGQRREGMYFGATSFAAKAAVGIGGQIAGVIVDVVGVAGLKGLEEAGPNVVRDLGIAQAATVALLITLSVVVFSRYDLTRRRHAQIQAELDERRNGSG